MNVIYMNVSYIAIGLSHSTAEFSSVEKAMDYLDPENYGLVVKVTHGDNPTAEVVYATKGEIDLNEGDNRRKI